MTPSESSRYGPRWKNDYMRAAGQNSSAPGGWEAGTTNAETGEVFRAWEMTAQEAEATLREIIEDY